MKKILVIAFLCAIVTSLKAQNTPWSTTGNIGIGTTNPTTALSVVGTGTFSTGVVAGNTTLNSNSLQFTDSYNGYFNGTINNGGLGYSIKAYHGIEAANAAGVVARFGSDKNSLNSYFNGNVGIGTTNPQGNLEIYSATNSTITPLFSIRSDFHTTGSYGMIRFGDYTQTTDYQKGAIIYESVAGSARGRFHIALENTDGVGSVSLSDAKLTVLSNGNVGVGTTTPFNTLHIVSGGNTSGQGGDIGLGANATAGPLFSIKSSLNIAGSQGDAGDVFFRVRADGNSPLNTAMTILQNSNVGIGTLSPDTKLAVNGTIHSKEVKVDLIGWSDYVFNLDYKLRPLNEVKTYIDQNHHLPDMPSAAEVEKDGLNLGEINKLLTKKIEELTLYLIEKDKQLDQQIQINRSNDERLKAIELKLKK